MMSPEVEKGGEIGVIMEAPVISIKENGSAIQLPEEKLAVCESKCEDHTFVDTVDKTPEENPVMACDSYYDDNAFHMEVSAAECDQVMASKGHNEDMRVEIVENVILDEEMVTERKSLDATESSSSFGCTDSETGIAGASSDVEVESQVRHDDASLMEFNGVSDLFKTRKKKLTAHWRNFVHPLMWRCKWVELQIRELRSQVSKYDRELAECSKRKHCELEKCATEDLATKSIPVCQNQPVRILKRKKRKRVEETENLTAYSSSHKLFSYFVNKRRSVDSAYLGDDHCNTGKTSDVAEYGFDCEWSFLEFKDGDAFESILRKIEETQIHISKLRLRIDKVVRENAEDFTSENPRLASGEPLASCGPSSVSPLVNGENFPLGNQSTISQHTSKMIQTSNQLQTGRKRGKIKNETLVYNQTVKEEPGNTAEQDQLRIKGKAKNVPSVSGPNSPSKTAVTHVRPKLATPNYKKKRGRRKARTGRWNRR